MAVFPFTSGQDLTAAELNAIGVINEVYGTALAGAPPTPANGGFIFKVGVREGVTSGFNDTVTFGTPFPNGIIAVLITATDIPAGSSSTAFTYTVFAASTTGFSITTSLSATEVAYSWFAVGF